MTPHHAKLLIAELGSIEKELYLIRHLLEDSIDKIVVALSSVN